MSLPGRSQFAEPREQTLAVQQAGRGWPWPCACSALGRALTLQGGRRSLGLAPPDSFPLKGWSCAGPSQGVGLAWSSSTCVRSPLLTTN